MNNKRKKQLTRNRPNRNNDQKEMADEQTRKSKLGLGTLQQCFEL